MNQLFGLNKNKHFLYSNKIWIITHSSPVNENVTKES